MRIDSTSIAVEYAAALHAYLEDGDAETMLLQAYLLGRQGVGSELGILDVVTIHREALKSELQAASTAEEAVRISQVATGLLLEALAPFEMASQGFQEANRQLIRMKQTLETEVAERTATLQQTIDNLRDTDRERQRLVRRLTTAQEEERARIASDIHDDPIQKISAAAMRLEMLAMDHPELSEDDAYAKAQTGIGSSLDSLRHLMFELRPGVLDSEGLAPALRAYLEEESKVEGAADYHFENRLGAEPPEETRVLLYRVAQEALTNVRKHARAGRVEVSLGEADGGFLVRVSDDGVGFEPADGLSSPQGHLGLTSMRERAEATGGRLTIAANPGGGTTVEFWLPRMATSMEQPPSE